MQRLKPSVSSKPPSRKTPFQPAHELQYGPKVMAKDASGVVCSVRCQFCKYFGREESKNGKRRRIQNQKFYKPPYRPQDYTDHNTTAHGIKWAQYQALSRDEKSAFFSGQISHNNQLSSHYEVESSTLSFDIPEHIVTDLIGKIYFNDEDEGASEPVALRAFGDADAGVYRLQIKTPFRFNLAIQHMSARLSFRQAATVIQQHYQATGNNKLYGMTDTLASTYARYLVAISFQRIGELMANSYMWVFAFASDISTHYERSFMDQRLRLAVDGVLVNIHLLAIPVFERHTAIVQFNLISTTLDVLYGQWRDKMIGVASDGENTMTGRHAGVVTLLENEATHPILRVWCAAHQMDLVMKAAFAIVDDGNFVKNTKDLIVHLRRQKLLIADMGTAAKKLTNRWLYMGNALEWILRNHAQLNTHLKVISPLHHLHLGGLMLLLSTASPLWLM
ncbi:hypothetical protein PPTG_05603 [Phytophthora nicotianae INRA-310]|uniref:DUF4371 domain-containing protein n=1 Tax=Phytophthora nicotianae (strain INRA-310) TaxID=761204 RepID=W2R0A9_PHYN3|nr:hypothetical protein PPTG_05603 [Phytophthora nicotianae INRA-310]ETN17945.1 hypothetical protein PPTG_05603 [Phytophthora nicotianae INRA-310]